MTAKEFLASKGRKEILSPKWWADTGGPMHGGKPTNEYTITPSEMEEYARELAIDPLVKEAIQFFRQLRKAYLLCC
ncbi:MAG: hypothetical protein WC389_08905 [Lutibacter sp.]|jgi:hypothetical protein